ncbi:MAG: hypothetical protein JOZ32_17885 [Bryobacterales bacterium]|nr:hypothetical protein [Bryobacterales bacterium]
MRSKVNSNITANLSRGGPTFVMAASAALVIYSYISENSLKILLVTVGLTLFVSAAGLEMYIYLQTSKRRFPSRVDYSSREYITRLVQPRIDELASEIEAIKLKSDQISSTGMNEQVRNQLKSINGKVDDFIKTIENRLSEVLLSSSGQQQVAAETISSLSTQTASDYLKKWSENIAATAISDTHIETLRRIASSVQTRLEEEIDNLGRRANLNLAIGSTISVLGIGVLAWYVFSVHAENSDPTAHPSLWFVMSTRLSLVIFIEVFAYFFLRLYRYSVFEIKNFQNEITSADFRAMALEAAMKNGDKATINKICLEMAKAERNFILKKGETTLALRTAEVETAADKSMGAYLDKLIATLQKHQSNSTHAPARTSS